MDFRQELDVAVRLANESNDIAHRFVSRPTRVSYKGPNDPVTEADVALNDFVVKALEEHFPNDAVLSEESSDDLTRLNSRRLWCVDPLDGTREFISGTGEFSIMIGLAVDGEAVMGVVQQPIPGITYWGTTSEAWIKRGKNEPTRLRVSSEDTLSEATLVVSRSHRVPLIDDLIRNAKIENVKRSGSVGVKCGMIASRQADLYVQPGAGTKEWDTCAPEAILRGAGGRITDTKGQQLRYNRPDIRRLDGIVASNGRLHAACLELMAELGNE